MDTAQKPREDWLPYGLPMILFLAVTYAEGQYPKMYVWIYFAKMIIVGGGLIWARSTWKDIKFEPKWIPLSVIVGVLCFVAWVGLENVLKYPHLGERTAYNPFKEIPDDGLRAAFIAVRFFGLVLLVPFMEELFWRSFALRFGSQADFTALPIGQFTMVGAGVSCAVFALSHPEWVVALIFAAAMTWLVWKTKSIFACFVAHAVTNLALGIYVMTQSAWTFW